MRKEDFKDGYGYFWLSKVARTDDWNSLPKETRKRSLKIIQLCLTDYCHVFIPEEELNELAEFGGSIVLVDAVLDLYASYNKIYNQYQLRRWLRTRIVNSIKEKLHYVPRQYKVIKPKKQKKSAASYEDLKQYSIYTLDSKCSVCGKKINSNNVTGICTKCQRKPKGERNGRESGC